MTPLNAPIEKSRPLLLSIGLSFAWAVALTAFEWQTPVLEMAHGGGTPIETFYPIEDVPITIKENGPAAPKPTAPAPTIDTRVVPVDVSPVDTDPVDQDPEVDIVPMDVFGSNIAPMVDPEVADIPVTFTEIMPMYPGGEAQLLKDLGDELKYPEISRELGISGVVHVQFIINKKGEVTNVTVARGVDPYLDQEAVRAVKTLKLYTPGRQGGRAVPVIMTIPVRFALRN